MQNIFLERWTSASLFLYLAILPFSFLIQATTHSKFIVLFLTLLLVLFLLPRLFKPNLFSTYSKMEILLVSLFFLTLATGQIVLIALEGDHLGLQRNILTYAIPALLFFAIRPAATGKLFFQFNFILILIGVLFAAIQIYSYVAQAPNGMERLLFDYIKLEYGAEKGEFLGSFRPPGPTDHVHLTSMFLAMGTLAAFNFFLKKVQLGRLALFLFIYMGLLATGVRLSLIFTLSLLFFHAFLFRKYLHFGKSLLIFALSTALIVGFLGLTTNNEDAFATIYINPILELDFATHMSLTKNVVEPSTDQLMSEIRDSSWFEFLVGHGYSSQSAQQKGLLNDDFFVLQIFTNFGLLGLLFFYALPFYLLLKLFQKIRKSINFPATLVFLLLALQIFSTIHSGTVFRRLMFPYFILVLLLSLNFLKIKSTENS